MSNKEEQTYSIRYRIDGSFSVEIRLSNASEAILIPKTIKSIENNLKLGKMLLEIISFCSEVDGTLIFPKVDKVSNEIRLVACTAAAYPDGFPKQAISDILDIADSSRDAYLNWETKTSSQYLTYNTETQRIHISKQGIHWVYSELEKRGILGIEESVE